MYGGTKTEMERLLADATKLTGKKYDISNLGDVYEAIHVIQENLSLTGVAADEAATTFTGSFNAMLASAKNLGAALATGGDIQPAMKSLATNMANFLFKNLVPMIGNVIKGLPTLIGTFITTAAPTIAEHGKKIVNGIITGITTGLTDLKAKGNDIVNAICNGIDTYSPTITSKGIDIMKYLGQGMVDGIPTFAEYYAKVIESFTNIVGTYIDNYGASGELISEEMASGFVKGLPKFLVNVVLGLGKISVAVSNGILKIVPKAYIATLKIAQGIGKGLGSGAVTLVKGAMKRIREAIEKPIKKARDTVKGIVEKIKGFFPLNVGRIMTNIKTPYIRISGGSPPYGIGGLGTKPTIGVEWHAKGGIFDNPSIIGVGEKGKEAVVPLSGRNMRPFAKTIADEMGGSGTTQIFNITMEGTNNPEEFADRFIREVKMRTRTA